MTLLRCSILRLFDITLPRSTATHIHSIHPDLNGSSNFTAFCFFNQVSGIRYANSTYPDLPDFLLLSSPQQKAGSIPDIGNRGSSLYGRGGIQGLLSYPDLLSAFS